MATETVAKPRTSARVHVQKFGTFLSGMIMPNIGAFIAWGIITALFIEKGWLPVPVLGGFGETDGKPNVGLVGPMITYLLPLLIGYTGGKNVYDVRGGVVGAIGTMGVIVGAGIPMFIGAMIMGPLGGWTMKKIDMLWDGKIRPGFEMLVNNFSAGIWGALLAMLGFFGISPLVTAFSTAAGNFVQFLVHNGLLPLTSIFIEPAKVLFLNNAINHGVLTPLGVQQSLEQGKSILFLLEANPGPGLGILLAYMVFGRGAAKASAPGAAIIQFLGGIHEIYFPYVLMRPLLILGAIAGGMTGIATLAVTNSGLVAPAAPGSIFAVLAQTSRDSYFGVILSVVLAATVSFLVSSLILRTTKHSDETDLSDATSRMEEMKGKKSSVASTLTGAGAGAAARCCRRRPRRSGRPGRTGTQRRIRLRRRHGLQRHGRLSAAEQDQGRRFPRRQGHQRLHRQPQRHLRRRGHAPGPDRTCQAGHRQRRPLLRGQLHEQPALRRDRRTGPRKQHRTR